MNMDQLQQHIEHLEQAAKRLLDAQAVWWAAVAIARPAGGTVPVDVRLELMDAQWQGFAPGPEVSMMFETLAEQLPDEGWWILVCSYTEYRHAVAGDRRRDPREARA